MDSFINLDDPTAVISVPVRKTIRRLIREDTLESVNLNSTKIVPKNSFYTRVGKRLIDFILSLFALIITLPFNLVIGICTFFDVGRPLFFVSERVGRNLKKFGLVKFRNMTNATDENGVLLPASERVTKFGKFVRKTSLDELLNFWSILKGDMSIIGPRPLPEPYVYSISERHKQRYLVRPGLECPNIHRVDQLTWYDQFENDVWYVENCSLKTDVKLVIALFKMVFDRKSNTMRSNAVRGSFEGYSKDGKTINSRKVPIEYYNRALEIYNSEQGEEFRSYPYI